MNLSGKGPKYSPEETEVEESFFFFGGSSNLENKNRGGFEGRRKRPKQAPAFPPSSPLSPCVALKTGEEEEEEKATEGVHSEEREQKAKEGNMKGRLL